MNSTKKFNEGYEKLKTVGQGSFGTATLYRRISDGKHVIMKEIFTFNMDSSERKAALNEVEILSTLNHSNIIRYIDSFQKEESLIIVMEYADAGNLAQLINFKKKRNEIFAERSTLDILQQITSAIAYMHGKKILHRDLKTANIFLNKDRTVKVGDFGISKMLNTLSQAQTVVGTPYYLSPEMCEGNDYNEKSDIWAIGCILYELCCLRKPFEAATLPVLVQKITTCEYDGIPFMYSKDLFSLIKSILQKNSALRPTANYICNTAVPRISKMYQNLNLRLPTGINKPSADEERSILYVIRYLGETSEVVPVELPHRKITDFSVSFSHRIVITSDNKIYVWGENEFGQLGLGTKRDHYDPIELKHLRDLRITRCCAGRNFSIFLNHYGMLYSCGDGHTGSLGHGDWNNVLTPLLMKALTNTNISNVCCGEEHVAALSSDGRLFTWGSSEHGQLGQGHFQKRCKPLAIRLSTQFKIKSIFCGTNATALITVDGKVLVSGNNAYGKLGFGDQGKINIFTLLKNIKEKIKCISMGSNHSAMLSESGRVVITMGRNSEGQLGKGNLSYYSQPQTLRWKNHITMVSCGLNCTAASDNRNVLWFWGAYNKDVTNQGLDTQKGFTNKSNNSNTVVGLKKSLEGTHSGGFLRDSHLLLIEDDVRLSSKGTAKKPQSIVALHSSTNNIKAGNKIFLGEIECTLHNMYVVVHTTCPPCIRPFQYTSVQIENYTTQKEDISKTLSLTTELPNTPRYNSLG